MDGGKSEKLKLGQNLKRMGNVTRVRGLKIKKKQRLYADFSNLSIAVHSFSTT